MKQRTRRNAAQSRETLLAAATEEFASHGLAGARIDRIAQAAGISKPMLYTYFGDKEALFDACLLYTSPSPRDRTRSRMPSSA